jgi:hypothetical protein
MKAPPLGRASILGIRKGCEQSSTVRGPRLSVSRSRTSAPSCGCRMSPQTTDAGSLRGVGREGHNADLFSPFIDRQSASRPGLAARRVPDPHVAFQPPLPTPLRQSFAPSCPTPGHRPPRQGSSYPAHVAHPSASAPACSSFAFSPGRSVSAVLDLQLMHSLYPIRGVRHTFDYGEILSG